MTPRIEPTDDCCLEGMASELFAQPIVASDTDLLGTIADLREQARVQAELIVGLTEENASLKADLWNSQHFGLVA